MLGVIVFVETEAQNEMQMRPKNADREIILPGRYDAPDIPL